MRYVFLKWQDFASMTEDLAGKIKESEEKFDGLYGVPRNGLVIAVCLSHKLSLPIRMHPTLDSLVVDDISDTGKTLAGMKNRKIATLFNTEWTDVKPNWFVEYKKSKDDWIVFPWEEDYIK